MITDRIIDKRNLSPTIEVVVVVFSGQTFFYWIDLIFNIFFIFIICSYREGNQAMVSFDLLSNFLLFLFLNFLLPYFFAGDLCVCVRYREIVYTLDMFLRPLRHFSV